MNDNLQYLDIGTGGLLPLWYRYSDTWMPGIQSYSSSDELSLSWC